MTEQYKMDDGTQAPGQMREEIRHTIRCSSGTPFFSVCQWEQSVSDKIRRQLCLTVHMSQCAFQFRDTLRDDTAAAATAAAV